MNVCVWIVCKVTVVCLCSQEEGAFVKILSLFVVGGGCNLVSRLIRTRGGLRWPFGLGLLVLLLCVLNFVGVVLGLACVTIQVNWMSREVFPLSIL